MSFEETAAGVIGKVGLWWPLADEQQIRHAAGTCDRVSAALLSCAEAGTVAAAQGTGAGQWGAAISALTARWALYDGADDAMLPSNAHAASVLAKALRDFSAEVESAKDKIRNLAIEVGAALLVSAALAPFTFGATAIAGSVRTAMFIGRGLMIGAGYGQALATIVTTGLALATFGAVEGFATSVISQALQWGFTDGTGIDLGKASLWGLGGAVAGLVVGGAAVAVGAGVRAVRGLKAEAVYSPAPLRRGPYPGTGGRPPIYQGETHEWIGAMGPDDLVELFGRYPSRSVIDDVGEVDATIGERARKLSDDGPKSVVEKESPDDAWRSDPLGPRDVYLNITSRSGEHVGENLIHFPGGTRFFVRGVTTRPTGEVDINLSDVTGLSKSQIDAALKRPQFQSDPRNLEDLFALE